MVLTVVLKIKDFDDSCAVWWDARATGDGVMVVGYLRWVVQSIYEHHLAQVVQKTKEEQVIEYAVVDDEEYSSIESVAEVPA